MKAMPMNDAPTDRHDSCTLPLPAAAELQDHLLTATHDLERLQTLLSDACDVLMRSFHGADARLRALHDGAAAFDAADLAATRAELGSAVTALQFQDMASQLIAHTGRRLRNCCDRLAAEAMGDDEDGAAYVEDAPLRPNPVTQDEMDAGSVELF
jgi:hypothetical protein